MNKKGISPLIATVLLIGFTVALVLLVTTWGSDYLQGILSGTERTTGIALKCSPPYLEFEVISKNCVDNEITIMNRGTEDIVKFNAIPYTESGVKPAEELTLGVALVSGDIATFDITLTDIKTLEIVAYILHDGKPTPCAGATREVDVDCVQ